MAKIVHHINEPDLCYLHYEEGPFIVYVESPPHARPHYLILAEIRGYSRPVTPDESVREFTNKRLNPHGEKNNCPEELRYSYLEDAEAICNWLNLMVKLNYIILNYVDQCDGWWVATDCMY